MKSRSKAQREAWISAAAGHDGGGGLVVAQITVPITNMQPGTTAPASTNAAYSHISNELNATGGTTSGDLSATVFSNLTTAPALQGQTVQSIQLGVTCSGATGKALIRRCRVQVGFWNADGPNGTAGTSLQGLVGFAQYQTDTLAVAPALAMSA